MQKSIDMLVAKFGKPSHGVPVENVTERTMTSSNAAVNRFKEKHQLEYRVCEHALSLNI
jgi:hypothetical protein